MEPPLNPGILSARKTVSFRKFAVWAAAILVGLFVVRFIVFSIGQALFWHATFAHRQVFQNQTIDEVQNWGAVVRPLIDESQTFDLAVTVWAPSAEDSLETPIYSEIPLRGLRLSDKHKQVNISYNLPVAVFQRLVLKDTDLRASFVVLPTSPSLMDYVTDFSTWRPEGMNVPPVRHWPFGSQKIDQALDSCGISMSLLEFHEVQSRCPNQRSGFSDEGDEDDAEFEDEDAVHPFLGLGVKTSDITKHSDHAVKRAPFVVTRTQIRAVDETHIFNRKAFNKEHNKLRSKSCGQGIAAVPESNLCGRTYFDNGNWETRLELQVPDEKDVGQSHTAWAYGPYIGNGHFASGPKDIVRIPVTREHCAQPESDLDDPEFIEINWQLSFSGRSPAKYVTTEIIPRPQRVPHNASAHKIAKVHDSAELWNGIYGHRFYEDAHPRRRAFISVLESIFSFTLVLLDMGYWHTRITTTSISISGTILIALSRTISGLTYISDTVENDKLGFSTVYWAGWLWLLVWSLLAKFYLPFLMLNTVTRLQFSWPADGSWVPTVRRISSTHKERSSQRLDARAGWAFQFGICISLTALYYLISPDENYYILSANIPSPGREDFPTNIVSRIHRLVSFPLMFTGTVSQLLLNHRAKTFAGCYKIAVAGRLALLTLALIVHFPSVVGRYDARPGLTIPQALNMILLIVMVYQAVVLPKAIQKLDDEDSM